MNTDFTLNYCLFGSVNLAENANLGQYNYSDYGIEFVSSLEFSFTDGSMGEKVIIFGADMSLYVHINSRNKDILILGEGPTKVLDDTTLTAETLCLINFTLP